MFKNNKKNNSLKDIIELNLYLNRFRILLLKLKIMKQMKAIFQSIVNKIKMSPFR